jgi:ribosomal protein S18 acetylase RimI-like enzyme
VINIRPAAAEELKELFKTIQAARWSMASRGIDQWDEIYPTEAILQEDLRKGELHVVAVEDRIAGMIVLNEAQSPEYAAVSWKHAAPALVVHRLTIDPQHQRQGLATRLMEFAGRTATLQGYNTIRLDAFTGNPGATALYERLGYRRAGTVQLRKGLFYCYEKQMKRNDQSEIDGLDSTGEPRHESALRDC